MYFDCFFIIPFMIFCMILKLSTTLEALLNGKAAKKILHICKYSKWIISFCVPRHAIFLLKFTAICPQNYCLQAVISGEFLVVKYIRSKRLIPPPPNIPTWIAWPAVSLRQWIPSGQYYNIVSVDNVIWEIILTTKSSCYNFEITLAAYGESRC